MGFEIAKRYITETDDLHLVKLTRRNIGLVGAVLRANPPASKASHRLVR